MSMSFDKTLAVLKNKIILGEITIFTSLITK